MAYVIKQKFQISELVNLPVVSKRIFVVEPDEYLLALYFYHLSRHGFEVKTSQAVDRLREELKGFSPQLILINLEIFDVLARAKTEDFLFHSPATRIITVGLGNSDEQIKSLLGRGVSAHIDRKFTRPQDVVTLAKTLIKNF